MRKLSLCLLPVLALALIISAAPAFAQSAAKADDSKICDLGNMAPDFTLPDGLTGEEKQLTADIVGQADLVALAFMNTTCSACQAEVSLLSKLADQHEGKLKVYMIAVDVRGEKLVKSYSEHYKYNVEYLLDPRFTIPPVYGFNYTPALVVLDKSGKVVYKKGGYSPKDADSLIQAIQDLL
jgi:thiol-disulfide isomerase/thioredoxin